MADKEIHVFRSTTESLQYVFKNGARAVFVGGKYATDNPAFAEELKAEIDNGNYQILPGTDDDKLVAESKGDVMEALRTKFFKEFQEQQAAQAKSLEEGKDLGSAPQVPVIPASTKTIMAVTANQAKK